MCGIAGTYRSTWDLEAALKRIRHRGPDGVGIVEDGQMRHGHVRLAVIDLSTASDQPFRYRDAVLSFNGEIWNFRELRDELAALGHAFRTTGDTEVLAAALCQWGTGALGRIEGMFAFAWSRGAEHVLARDRYGKIPLYVRRASAGFEWASERKAWPVGAQASPLPPGAWLDLPTGKVHRWYALPRSSRHAPHDVAALLRAGVERRMVADAPLCVLASGGLDSTFILAIAKRMRPDIVAYAAKYSDTSPDLLAARAACKELGVPLREVQVPAPTDALIEQAIHAIEIPSKAQTEIALLCLPLARRIAADGFKVCLSGEAADELFGGYGNMAIAASQAGADWRAIRVAQLEKMSRGNFIRCNKAFMSAGVECRLPFMDRALVECVLALDKAQCPPGKGLLKRAADGLVPPYIIKRQKETFQGASGMADACASTVAHPTLFYNATVRKMFGGLVDA